MGAWNKQMFFMIILLGSILNLVVNGAPGVSLIVHANNRTANDVFLSFRNGDLLYAGHGNRQKKLKIQRRSQVNFSKTQQKHL